MHQEEGKRPASNEKLSLDQFTRKVSNKVNLLHTLTIKGKNHPRLLSRSFLYRPDIPPRAPLLYYGVRTRFAQRSQALLQERRASQGQSPPLQATHLFESHGSLHIEADRHVIHPEPAPRRRAHLRPRISLHYPQHPRAGLLPLPAPSRRRREEAEDGVEERGRHRGTTRDHGVD